MTAGCTQPIESIDIDSIAVAALCSSLSLNDPATEIRAYARSWKNGELKADVAAGLRLGLHISSYERLESFYILTLKMHVGPMK